VVQDLGKETTQGQIPEGFDAVLQQEQGRWALLSQSPELPFSAS
jgi:hypothetical protein